MDDTQQGTSLLYHYEKEKGTTILPKKRSAPGTHARPGDAVYRAVYIAYRALKRSQAA